LNSAVGWKLFRLRRDGTLGPLFIDCRLRVPIGQWLVAECHPRKGYAVRPGWHVAPRPEADHLSMKGRVWRQVEIEDFVPLKRPARQGGMWWLAKRMRVVPATLNEKGA
jgi:hypothetical protein